MDGSAIFGLFMAMFGVAFGAIQLYFRAERKAIKNDIDTHEKRLNKIELRDETRQEQIKNLFQTHVAWVQREIENFRRKCEDYRKDQTNDVERVANDTETDQKEIIRLRGEYDLLRQKLEVIEQFFMDAKALWETKAEMLQTINSLKREFETLKSAMIK